MKKKKQRNNGNMAWKLSKLRNYKKYLGKYKEKVFKEFHLRSEEEQTDINTVIEESSEF